MYQISPLNATQGKDFIHVVLDEDHEPVARYTDAQLHEIYEALKNENQDGIKYDEVITALLARLSKGSGKSKYAATFRDKAAGVIMSMIDSRYKLVFIDHGFSLRKVHDYELRRATLNAIVKILGGEEFQDFMKPGGAFSALKDMKPEDRSDEALNRVYEVFQGVLN